MGLLYSFSIKSYQLPGLSKIFFLLFLNCIILMSCDLISNKDRSSEDDSPSLEEIEDNNFDEGLDNGIESVTGDKNIDLGFDYWNNKFKINDRFLEPELPNGCTNFDEIFFVNQEQGSDANDGASKDKPFKTINAALSKVSKEICSLIKVSKGTYLETLNLQNDEKNRTTIFGENRDETIILSKQPMGGWEKLSDEECPGGEECNIYKLDVGFSLNLSYHIHYKDKIITPVKAVGQYSFREKLQASDLLSGVLPTNLDDYGLPFFRVTNDFLDGVYGSDFMSGLTSDGRESFKNHMLEVMMSSAEGLKYHSSILQRGDLTFSGIEAINYIHNDHLGNYTCYFRALDDEANPQNFISKQMGYSISILDSSDIVIQNLTIKNGRYNVLIQGKTQNIKVIGNILKGGYRNIYVVNNGSDSPSEILITGNQITNSFSLNPDPQSLSHYRNFLLIKETMKDVHGVYLLNAGDNISVSHNFFYGVSNGIQVSRVSSSYQSDNLDVHHNLIINTLDDALEPGGHCENCRWHHNHIRNAAQSIRLKLKDSLSTGPVFIYKNVTINSDKYSYNEDKNPFHNSNTEVYFHTGSTVPIYFYNNIFNGSRCLIMPTGGNIGEAGKNFYFINNIFNCRYSIGLQRVGAYPSGITEGEKNLQILFSHNWLGGEFDDRPSWQNGKLYLRDYEMFTFDGTNLRETSDEGEVGESYFGESIGQNSKDNFLERTDFCQTKNSTSISGLDVSDANNLQWNYNDTVVYGATTYVHEIDRRITDSSDVLMSLPGVDGNYIGAFENDSDDCDELEWLLPN